MKSLNYDKPSLGFIFFESIAIIDINKGLYYNKPKVRKKFGGRIMNIFELVQNNSYHEIKDNDWNLEQLNQKNNDGLTPLMVAASLGYVDCVLALKDKGADIHITDKNGRKAVHLASFKGHGLVMLNLIEGGCGG